MHISIIRDRFLVLKDGTVKNLKTGKYLKHQICRAGYHRVGLSVDGKRKLMSVHRLVMMCHKPNKNVFSPKLEVNHKDGNKGNNHISNLEWCTRSENMAHARNKLKRKMGKIKETKKIEMVKYLCKEFTNKDIAALLKTTSENISRIKNMHE